MDSCPNFSLGLSQLDIPVGFVPGTFHFEESDFAENRSKHRNDPTTMKKLKEATTSKSEKSTSKTGMKYHIDKIPEHSLHILSLCNCGFAGDIKSYFGEDVLGTFRYTLFGIFLDLPQCNWIGKISKCLLMLEIQQDIKDEIHVCVQGKILKFTMLEFAIITGLKCTNDIDEFMYTSSSKSPLMLKYFPESGGGITRSKLITRVKMGNFENSEDALNLTILYFIHTFMLSQHKEGPISVAHFQMVECNEDQSRVVTRDDDYDDFTTGPTQKFLRNSHLAKPVSTEQPSKRRKTVIFQKVSPVATDGQKSTSSHSVCRVSEIGVSPEREQLKSVPSSSSMPEGTSKSNLNVEQIKSYIKTYIAELKTLISNIPTEVVKALKKEENKESLS
ncbi:hypothetical protein P3S67_030664 [Capsicum chacoense]